MSSNMTLINIEKPRVVGKTRTRNLIRVSAPMYEVQRNRVYACFVGIEES